jgi:uncharacterized membrane protein YhaH (DUF805 family)
VGFSGWWVIVMTLPAVLFIFHSATLNDDSSDFEIFISLVFLGVFLLMNLVLFFLPSDQRDNKYGSCTSFSFFGNMLKK